MCWLGLMNPAVTNFCTSYTIYASILVWNALAGWATGLVLGSTLSVCTTKFGFALGISSYSHANTSLNSFSNSMKFVFSSLVSLVLI